MDLRKIIIGLIAVSALLVAVLWFRQPALKEDYNARLEGKIFEVTAQLSGGIKQAGAQANMFVSRDFPLYEIENQATRQEYEQANAALAAAEQGFVSPEASLSVNMEQFESRVNRAERAEIDSRKEQERLSLALSEATYNRRKAEANSEAYTADYITQAKALEEELRNSFADAKDEHERAAQIRYRAQQELAAVKEQHRLFSTPQGMAALRQYELEAAQERMKAARESMENLTVRAPVDGYVLDIFAGEGDQVELGSKMLSIAPLDAEYLWLTAFFDEKIAANLVIGQPCTITFTALSGLTLSGKVQSIRPATLALPLPDAEFSANFSNTGNLVPVVVSLEGYDPAEMPQLRLGMTAKVTPEQ